MENAKEILQKLSSFIRERRTDEEKCKILSLGNECECPLCLADNLYNMIGISNTTTAMDTWSSPEFIEMCEYPDKIEVLYKQTSMVTLTVHPSPPPEQRVFKIVFSCVDGKWNKSEPIYGQIISAQAESYEFEE